MTDSIESLQKNDVINSDNTNTSGGTEKSKPMNTKKRRTLYV